MFKKSAKQFDAFSLSLGGMTTIAGFASMPVIPHDRLRKEVRLNLDAQPADTAGKRRFLSGLLGHPA